MKPYSLLIILFLSPWLQAEETSVKHQFVCIGNHKDILVYVDQFTPENSWSIKIAKGSRDIQLLDNDRLLVSHGDGASEYSLSNGKKLEWEVSGYKNIQSARRLSSGRTVLLSQKGLLITLDKEGKELEKLKIKGSKLDLRLLRANQEGNWIIGSKLPKAILVINPKGSILKQYKLPGKSYKAIQLENGNFLSSTGDSSKVVEISSTNKIVRFVGGKAEHPSLNLDFNSGWSLAQNGNIIMCNWLGHDKHHTAAHLLEFDSTNKLVWKWENHKLVKQVTNCLLIK